MNLLTLIRLATFVLIGGGLVFSLVIAYILDKPILGWVYDRVRPKDYEEKTVQGERIEAKFEIDFWTTTFRWILGWVFKILLINIFTLFIANRILVDGDSTFGFTATIFYYLVLFLLVSQFLGVLIAFPLGILWTDWRLRYRIRIIVKTTEIVTYALRLSLTGIVTGDAPLPYVSRSRMVTAKTELRWSADPQDIDNTIKTDWLTDQLIALRASEGKGWHFWGGGVRSMLLLTFYQRGIDRIALVKRGSTLLKIIDASAPRAQKLQLRQQRLDTLMTDVEIGRAGIDYDEAKVQTELEDLRGRSSQNQWPADKFDPFTIGETDIWNKETAEENVPYDFRSRESSETVYVR